MSADKEIRHITPAGEKVCLDSGFSPEEEAALCAESTRIFAEKLAIKDFLMAELVCWIAERRLKPAGAAQVLGVTSEQIADLIDRKPAQFTIDSLVDLLIRTGKHVKLWGTDLEQNGSAQTSELARYAIAHRPAAARLFRQEERNALAIYQRQNAAKNRPKITVDPLEGSENP